MNEYLLGARIDDHDHPGTGPEPLGARRQRPPDSGFAGGTGPAGAAAVFAAHPELRPPHGFLTSAENRLLDWLYVRGAAYEGVSGR